MLLPLAFRGPRYGTRRPHSGAVLPLKPKPSTQHRQTHTNPNKTPDHIAGLGATVQGIRPKKARPPICCCPRPSGAHGSGARRPLSGAMLPRNLKPQTQHRQTHINPNKTPDCFAGLGATVQRIRPKKARPPICCCPRPSGINGTAQEGRSQALCCP